MRHPLVIDLETQKTFRDVTEPRELLISVAGAYNYGTDQLSIYEEHELSKLFTLFENAAIIIGFNLDSFDMPVISRYYPGDISKFRTFDMLTDVKNLIGRRIRLDDLVQATLGAQKSGHGLQAIQYFREGKMDELKNYCMDDVRLTKELFDYGVQQGRIFYPDAYGDSEKRPIHVKWERYMEHKGDEDVPLTLRF